MAGDDRAVGEDRAQVRGGERLAGLRAQRLQVRRRTRGRWPSWPSTLIAAAMSAVLKQAVEVGQREHQHAEHAVGAVDQREAFLLGQHDRRQAVRRQRVAGVEKVALGISDRAFAHHRERDVRQRREVTGTAEAAVLVHHRSQAAR